MRSYVYYPERNVGSVNYMQSPGRTLVDVMHICKPIMGGHGFCDEQGITGHLLYRTIA